MSPSSQTSDENQGPLAIEVPNKRRFGIQNRMILAMCLMALLQTVLLGGYALWHLADSVEEEIGHRALQLAKAVALLPEVIDAVERQDSATLTPFIEQIRSTGDARFIVVGDAEGIRLAHPVSNRIGKPMVGDDNRRALEQGESYVSKATGSLGPSIRGKTAIFNAHGDIIGVVSVGYLIHSVTEVISDYQKDILVVIVVVLLFTVLMAIWISDYFKRSIFGLEPEQIAQLYTERNATLESVREGIIALNAKGHITTFNKAAVDILGLGDALPLTGRHIRQVLPNSTMLETLDSKEPLYDQEITRYGRAIVVNRIPIFDKGAVSGIVSSFRLKDELDRLSRKLTQTEQYAETLRSQAHEYSNKLQTIAGLIEIGAYGEALEIVGRESREHQSLIHLLAESVKEPVLSGCLLGKFNRAHELGIELQIDPESRLLELPAHIAPDQLVTIVGNLLDNAFDATVSANGREVQLSISDFGQDLIFEVEDQGPGISEELEKKVFEKGFTTKRDDGHGWGLYLIRKITEQLKGEIILEQPKTGGARMTVYLPKTVVEQ